MIWYELKRKKNQIRLSWLSAASQWHTSQPRNEIRERRMCILHSFPFPQCVPKETILLLTVILDVGTSLCTFLPVINYSYLVQKFLGTAKLWLVWQWVIIILEFAWKKNKGRYLTGFFTLILTIFIQIKCFYLLLSVSPHCALSLWDCCTFRVKYFALYRFSTQLS